MITFTDIQSPYPGPVFLQNSKHLQGQIYFMQSGNGSIKIGYSTNIEARVSLLQSGNPEILKILRVFPGNIFSEILLQKKFKEYKIHGEWFHPVPELLNFISNITDQNFYREIDALKPKKKRRFKIKTEKRNRAPRANQVQTKGTVFIIHK